VGARSASTLAWSLCGLAVALFVGLLVLGPLGEAAEGPQIGLFDYVVFAAFLAYAGVGALVAARHPRNPIGWLLLAQGVLFQITGFGLAYVRYGLFARPGSLPGGSVGAWLGEWAWIPEFFTVPVLFFLLFPDGQLPSRRWRPVAWLVVSASVAGFVAIAFAPGNFEDSLAAVRNPFGIDGAESILALLGSAATAVAGPVLIASLVAFVLRFRSSSGTLRRQMSWVGYAAIALIVSFTLGNVLQAAGLPASVTSNFWVLPVVFIPVATGIAVLRYRLYDIDLLIAGSVVFGGLAAFATVVYLGVIVGFGAAVGRTTGSNLALAIVATALVATAFQPVRLRMHDFARRIAFGQPSDDERRLGVAITCLGAFRVFRDGTLVPLTAWQSKKARTLLKILIARRGRTTPRAFLMEALWPAEDPDKVANRFSVALATVRSVLDPDRNHPSTWFVAGDPDAVRLDLAHVAVDVETFLAVADRGLDLQRQGRTDEAELVLREAQSRYGGEFLAEDLYDDWASPLRDQARNTYVAVARALAEIAAHAGNVDAASGSYLRVLEEDPWDEDAHLALVGMLAAAGRHGQAQRCYAAYVARMGEIDVAVAPFPSS
jgi:DNA-binding SARP family transcriptional activator